MNGVKVKPVPLLMAAAAGSLMAVQGAFNSLLAKAIGLPRTTLLVHVLGTLAAGVLVLLPWRDGGSFGRLGESPWYTLLGGPIGVGIVLLVAASIARTGAGAATTAIIVAQLLTAYLLDHFGLFGLARLPFDLWKAAGIGLIAAGGWLLLC
ncbi:MAG: DMT family transporter [Patescibacteria group bacterium]